MLYPSQDKTKNLFSGNCTTVTRFCVIVKLWLDDLAPLLPKRLRSVVQENVR